MTLLNLTQLYFVFSSTPFEKTNFIFGEANRCILLGKYDRWGEGEERCDEKQKAKREVNPALSTFPQSASETGVVLLSHPILPLLPPLFDQSLSRCPTILSCVSGYA